MQKSNLEQRYAMEFCAQLRKGASDAYEEIRNAFCTTCSCISVARRLCTWAVEAVEDEPRSGRPAPVRTSTNVDRVRAFLRQDRRSTIRMIADEVNVCTVHQMVTQDVNMRKVLAMMIPKHLNDNQTRKSERWVNPYK
jgi:hypothetical protein